MIDVINVCMVCNRFFPMIGGAEAQCKLLSEKLVSLNECNVDVVTYRHDSSLPKYDAIESVRITRLSRPSLGLLCFYIQLFLYLLSRRMKYDVIHCHSISMTSFICVLAAYVMKKPVILKHTINGELENLIKVHPFTNGFKAWIKKVLISFAVRKATVIITLSDEGEEELKSCKITSYKKIPNGVDVVTFEKKVISQTGYINTNMPITYGFLGRFCEQKGIDTLLTAFAKISNNAENKKLILMGSSAYQLESGIDQCLHNASISLQKRLDIWSPQSPPYEFYKSISIYVSASRYEGLPNTVLEALACRKICILSNIKPHAELQQNNPKSQIYLFSDEQELKWLLDVITHDLSISTERVIADEYNIDYVVSRYFQLYIDII